MYFIRDGAILAFSEGLDGCTSTPLRGILPGNFGSIDPAVSQELGNKQTNRRTYRKTNTHPITLEEG